MFPAQGGSSGLSPVELLLAEEEQKAAKKASGKKSAPAKKQQAKALPQFSSPDTSSQDSASTVNPAHLQSAAAADSESSAWTTAPVFSSQERFGKAAYAKMNAEIASRPPPPNLPGFYGMPESDICQTFDQDYAKQCEQLLAEEAAQAAAESLPSSSPADHSADSAGQLTGLMTTRAAACGPATLADGTKKKLASLLQSKSDQAPAARLSPLESELSVCTFYPDDFIMRCSSEAEAATLVQQAKGTFQQDGQQGEEPVAVDPTAALVNFRSILHQSLRCPLSEVWLLPAHCFPH